MKVLLLFLAFLSHHSLAADCSLLGQPAMSLLQFDTDKSHEKKLSKFEVMDDLECLKLMFANRYVGLEYYDSINFSKRVDNLSLQGVDSSLKLLDRIKRLHQGMNDAHLMYEVFGVAQVGFSSLKDEKVELVQNYSHEKVYERREYTYFRPGFLRNVISEGMQDFVALVADEDRKYVLDLRGNSGGDDAFAEALAQALFTSAETIPRTRRLQLESPFQRAGHCISLYFVGYEGVEEFCKSVAQEISGKTIRDVLEYTFSEYTQDFRGERKQSFKSDFIILTDSGCASSCETIVEKLSYHPKVRVVGKNTMGALHFSNAATYMLPNSGVIVRMPTLFHEYENDALEGVGYTPDIITNKVDLDSLF